MVNYTITATSSDGSRNITVPASEVDGSTTVNVGGLDVCTRTYSFTVAPETSEGTGPRSESVGHDAGMDQNSKISLIQNKYLFQLQV